MLCRKPFMKKSMSFGCGQCLPCRLNKRRLWTHRIMLESLVHKEASFLTLTYAQVPPGGTLEPRDLTLFLKKLRKTLGPFRYFAVGEYGDQSWRPHYHLALFGHGTQHSNTILKTWGKGHTYTGTLTLQSAQYVAGYVTKKMTSKNDPRLSGLYPEFARMSLRPGIGAPAVSCLAEALSNKNGWDLITNTGDVPSVLAHGRRKLPLGRYLRTRLRNAMNFENTGAQDNRDEVWKKSAEMQALYANYLLDQSSGKPSFSVQLQEEEDQIVRIMTNKFKIWNRGTL